MPRTGHSSTRRGHGRVRLRLSSAGSQPASREQLRLQGVLGGDGLNDVGLN